MDSIVTGTVLSLCQQLGPLLKTPVGLDGAAVMAAIAANESSLGANCTPRHEPAYDFGGHYAINPDQAKLLEKYGSAAAYSYGPWQMMPVNAPGVSPDTLHSDPRVAARSFVSFFNRYIIDRHKAENLEQIAQCYNAGHYDPKAPAGPVRYASDAQGHYVSLLARLNAPAPEPAVPA